MFITRVGVATLNQWAMDFDLNKKHIIESIQLAKSKYTSIIIHLKEAAPTEWVLNWRYVDTRVRTISWRMIPSSIVGM